MVISCITLPGICIVPGSMCFYLTFILFFDVDLGAVDISLESQGGMELERLLFTTRYVILAVLVLWTQSRASILLWTFAFALPCTVWVMGGHFDFIHKDYVMSSMCRAAKRSVSIIYIDKRDR